MNVVTRKHLLKAEVHYPDAARELRAWFKIATEAHWRSLLEVRQSFNNADAVDEFVVFNIRRNRYRLIVVVHYSKVREERLTEGHIYIRSFLTHKQYDDRANWNKGAFQ